MTKPPSWWQHAIRQFSERDPILTNLLNRFPDSYPIRRSNAFEVLINSITGQQISVKAADTIRERLYKTVKIAPDDIIKIENAPLREVGLSGQKTQYIKNIAHWFQTNQVDASWFEKKTSEEIAHELLNIKGIGKWTLQMFQIFYLQESNILPINDLGLIKAVENAYQVDRKSAISEIPKIAAEKWNPYSTAAVWFLWRSIDPEEVSY